VFSPHADSAEAQAPAYAACSHESHVVLSTMPQTPLWHVSPTVQALPHAPQSVGDVCKSAHPSLQLASDPQDVPPGVHTPCTQLSLLAQVTPHAPQLVGDTVRSTQPSSHDTSGARHDGVVP
jgi:hypothetical protein